MMEVSNIDDLVLPVEASSVGSRWAIGTYLRIRPPGPEDTDLVQYKIQNAKGADNSNRSIIELDIPLDADPGLVHNNSATGTLKYEFDNVFNTSASQEDVFQTVARDKVLDALEGVNCTVFAYGQTGSGKTFSIFGGESFQDRGLIPRSLSMLFKELKDRKLKNPQFQFKVRISFTEIYKETVYDLLHQQREDQVSLETFPTVQVMEGEEGIILRNLSVYEVSTKEDALKLFFLGNKNRITTATTMNNVSSRSHAIFTIAVDTEGRKGDRTVFTSGKINLVDLAGSERMYKMANTKEAITEAKSINLSLHYLEQVIVCLREQANQLRIQQQQQQQQQSGGTLKSVSSSSSLLIGSEHDMSVGIAGNVSNKDIPRDPATARQSGASTNSAVSGVSGLHTDGLAPMPSTSNTAGNNNNNNILPITTGTNSTTNSGKSQFQRNHSMHASRIHSNNSSSKEKDNNNNKDSKDDGPKSYFIPYRNSVLTSMLRDSLGGNCRSSFLLTISPLKLHFEETIASCRFGQRCGEVKVKVQANTEISLHDQLKDLQHKVKIQERKYSQLDDQRKQIERMLQAEQELRAIQTSIRALTPQEKVHCKTCVQELLAQAKDSLAIATQQVEDNNFPIDQFHPPPQQQQQHAYQTHQHFDENYEPKSHYDAHMQEETTARILPPLYADPEHNPPDPQAQQAHKQQLIKDIANDLVEKTQDELYTQLESMDKAVLVELATALGGLVQSLFIDREMIKQEMLLQEIARQQAAQAEAMREKQEHKRREIFRRGTLEDIMSQMDALPDTVIQALVYGAMFLKHSSSKNFLMVSNAKTVPRYVSISPDLRYLLWRAVESQHTPANGASSGGTVLNNSHNNVPGAHGHAMSSMMSSSSSVNNNNANVNRRSLRAALGLVSTNNANNNHHDHATGLQLPLGASSFEDTMTASGAEDVVSIPLSAFDQVEYHPMTRTIELRAKSGQAKNLILECLSQNHTVGSMAELFHQPQYQYAVTSGASAFTLLDFVLSGEEWTKSLKYLILRANQSQQAQQVVSYHA